MEKSTFLRDFFWGKNPFLLLLLFRTSTPPFFPFVRMRAFSLLFLSSTSILHFVLLTHDPSLNPLGGRTEERRGREGGRQTAAADNFFTKSLLLLRLRRATTTTTTTTSAAIAPSRDQTHFSEPQVEEEEREKRKENEKAIPPRFVFYPSRRRRKKQQKRRRQSNLTTFASFFPNHLFPFPLFFPFLRSARHATNGEKHEQHAGCKKASSFFCVFLLFRFLIRVSPPPPPPTDSSN